MKTLRLL